MNKKSLTLLTLTITFFIASTVGTAPVLAAEESVNITFTLSGLDPTILDAIIKVDGIDYFVPDFPLKFSWISGSTHIIIPTISIQQVSDSRYTLINTSWQGLTGTEYTVPPVNSIINLEFEVFYLLSIRTVGITTSYPSSIYVNGTLIGDISDRWPVDQWMKKTSKATLRIEPEIVSAISRRYHFTRWKEDNTTDPQRTIEMSAPQNVTAIFTTQWQVEILPDSDIKGSVEPSGTLYFDPETTTTVQCSPKEGYLFTGWTTRGQIFPINATQMKTNVFINGTGWIKANFASTTVQIYVTTSGISDYNETILTIDNEDFTFQKLQERNPFNWVAGSTHKVTANSQIPINNVTRYEFATWVRATLPSDLYTVPYANATFTALFRPIYYLSVNNGGYGNVQGEGWRLGGTTTTITIEPTIVSVGTGVQYVFKGWNCSSSKGYNGENSTASFILTEALTETAVWEKEYIPLTNNETNLLWIINLGVVGICLFVVGLWVISKLRRTA